MKSLIKFPGSALLIALAGCSGGNSDSSDDGSNPPPSPRNSAVGGLWSGALWWDASEGHPEGAMNARALVAETGEFRIVLLEDADGTFIDQEEQIFGTFSIQATSISTSSDSVWAARVSSTGDDWAEFGMSGDFEAREDISGSFRASWSGWTHVEERVGTLSMTYHSAYEQPSSFEILRGTYRTESEVMTIDSGGRIFYMSSANGCVGNGSAEIINPNFNMYRLSIEVAGCNESDDYRNGLTFTGLANIGENNDIGGAFLNATLEMAVSASRGLPFGHGYVAWSLAAHKD